MKRWFKIETDHQSHYISIGEFKPTKSRNFTFVSTNFIFTSDPEADAEEGFNSTYISTPKHEMFDEHGVIDFVFEEDEEYFKGTGKFFYQRSSGERT